MLFPNVAIVVVAAAAAAAAAAVDVAALEAAAAAEEEEGGSTYHWHVGYWWTMNMLVDYCYWQCAAVERLD